MNYFDIINKVLIELNYKSVSDFSELVKSDHIKIKQVISRLNSEICSSSDWNFLLRKTSLTLKKDRNTIENSVFGRIKELYIDNLCYRYEPNISKLLYKSFKHRAFSVFENKIYLPKFDSDKQIDILYYTNNSAKDAADFEKMSMEKEDDCSLIPLPYSELVLIYGSCMRFKGNSSHVKFKYWFSMYTDALRDLKSKAITSVYDIPRICF